MSEHFVLWLIDVFVALCFGWHIRWGEHPFRRATKTEKRVGGLLMGLWPACLLVIEGHAKSLEPIIGRKSC